MVQRTEPENLAQRLKAVLRIPPARRKTFRELLLRRADFLIFQLQIVDYLRYVGDSIGDAFGAGDLRFFDDFFYLGDFLLDFACYVFDDAVGFEVGVVDQFAGLGFDGAFYFVQRACSCVFSAFFHLDVPPG